MKLTPDILTQAKNLGSPADLADFARSHGVSLTGRQAETCFTRLRSPMGELTDWELDHVTGGGCGETDPPGYSNGYKLIHSTDQACVYYQCDRCQGGRDSHSPTCRIAINALDPDSSGLGRLFYNTCYGCYYGDFGGSLDGCCWNPHNML